LKSGFGRIAFSPAKISIILHATLVGLRCRQGPFIDIFRSNYGMPAGRDALNYGVMLFSIYQCRARKFVARSIVQMQLVSAVSSDNPVDYRSLNFLTNAQVFANFRPLNFSA
jgi:hypothetical protein